MGPTIEIAIEHAAWDSLGDVDTLVSRAVAAALAESGSRVPPETELSVVLCDDAFIRKLNRDWRGKDAATNVLSFPAEASARHATIGDVVVAYETTAGEAASDGKRLDDHVVHLIVHGVLHLLGYDHETEPDAEAMERVEVRALSALGIGSPYEDAVPLRSSP